MTFFLPCRYEDEFTSAEAKNDFMVLKKVSRVVGLCKEEMGQEKEKWWSFLKDVRLDNTFSGGFPTVVL